MNKHPEHREELEERAAIMEYHGGMDRRTAEETAADRIAMKYKLFMPEGIRQTEVFKS